jgi:hypothetical protein
MTDAGTFPAGRALKSRYGEVSDTDAYAVADALLSDELKRMIFCTSLRAKTVLPRGLMKAWVETLGLHQRVQTATS